MSRHRFLRNTLAAVGARVALSIPEAIRAVSAETGVSHAAIMSRNRRRPIAWARQEVWRRLYATDAYSFPEIGQFFDRHHTTVLDGVRAAETRNQA